MVEQDNKKEREMPHKLALRRRYFDYSKVYCDVTERWLLAWNQNKHVTYYIFHKLARKPVLVSRHYGFVYFEHCRFQNLFISGRAFFVSLSVSPP